MKRTGSVSLAAASLALVLAAGILPAQAVEVLQNVSLEESAGPAGWNVTQFITGEPGSPIAAYEHVGLANNPPATPGGLGLFLKPQAGNTGVYVDQNKAINVVMTQVEDFGPTAAGRTWNFNGQSFFQLATSANLDTLPEDSPSGEVASPTEAYMEMAFLDANDMVLGTPTRLDLPKNRPTDVNPDDWLLHNVNAVAPAMTTKIRVTAAATNMVASCTTMCTAGQDIYFDNFSLTNTQFPQERLENGNLNVLGAPGSWEIEKTPQDNLSFSGNPSFAAHTGNVGMWLRSFAGGDAKILQTVPAVAGEDYTFTGWGKLQHGHIGLDPFSGSVTFMTMEFLDGSNMVIDTVTKNVGTDYVWEEGDMGQGVWQPIGLPTTAAPLGTQFVRVSIGGTLMGTSGIDPQSALFDDFSLITTAAPPGLAGDFNDDGIVDAADYVSWRKNEGTNNTLPNDGGLGTPIDSEHYDLWAANFGNTAPGSGSGSGGLAAVPEPSSVVLLLAGIALGMTGLGRRSGR